jgi:DNA invertase Pin-like site-specific DNA recombinase
MEVCRRKRATLCIAKLDRLARNVHFISGLMESNVNFVAVDQPTKDRFMLHLQATFAEEEARRISIRTKEALAAANPKGTGAAPAARRSCRRQTSTPAKGSVAPAWPQRRARNTCGGVKRIDPGGSTFGWGEGGFPVPQKFLLHDQARCYTC